MRALEYTVADQTVGVSFASEVDREGASNMGWAILLLPISLILMSRGQHIDSNGDQENLLRFAIRKGTLPGLILGLIVAALTIAIALWQRHN
jgi:hypothetical protein